MTRSGHRIGFILVSASAVAWSLGGLFTRIIQLDSWTMLAWRGIFGALGLAAVMVALRQRDTLLTLRNMGWLGWLFVLQSALGMIVYLTALRHTTVANVAVIYATAPFLAAGLGWLVLRERPTTSSIVASVVALIGVAVMVGFGHKGGLLGDLLALGMTWAMASTMVVARHYRGIPILLTACISSLLSGIVSWPFAAALSVSRHDLMLLALFGVVNFAIGLPLFTYGARLLPAIETALIGAVDAPLAPLWVWLAFNETPSLSTIIGGAIVFSAVAIHLIVGEANRFSAPAAGAAPAADAATTAGAAPAAHAPPAAGTAPAAHAATAADAAMAADAAPATHAATSTEPYLLQRPPSPPGPEGVAKE
jgi:drug/metabolite transporter (DMT)-like permease